MGSRTNMSALCQVTSKMDKKTTIGFFIGTLALTGAATYDYNTFSGSEIAKIKANAGITKTNEAYILTEILNDKVPQFDISTVSAEDISKAYIAVANKLGDDLKKGEDKNLYSRIRTEAKKKQ